MTTSYNRTPAATLPLTPCRCIKTACVYNEDGICDEAQINRGNEDAECFGVPVKTVKEWITEEK